MGIVRNDTKSSVGGIFLHNSTQGHLGRGGHSIGFVENNQFEGA